MADDPSLLGVVCQRQDLRIVRSGNLFDHLVKRDDGVVGGIEARRAGDVEAVAFDIETNLPQDPAYPILRRERVCVLFGPGDDRPPCVLVLRDDFPSTPHQNQVPDGCPACLCVDDRAWIEARPTWSSRELVHRISRWFERAGMGDLHDVGQMVDPFFMIPGASVIVPRAALEPGQGDHFAGAMKAAGHPIQVFPVAASRSRPHVGAPIVFHLCAAKAAPMNRIRKLPNTLARLASDLIALDIDLMRELELKITGLEGGRRNSILVIVVSLPVLEPSTGAVVRQDLIGFRTSCSVGDVGVGLNILFKNDSGLDAGGYVPNFGIPKRDPSKLDSVLLQALQVHRDFDPAYASRLSGRPDAIQKKMVIIGAGTIGSAVVEPLVREGRSDWTIVDPDVLLPHNLARHTLTGNDVADFKTRCLATRLRAICGEANTSTIEADVLNQRDASASLKAAFDDADIVIDAAASVPVGRFVSDLDCNARRASVFFNPAGDEAVMLVEDDARQLDLRYLEARYYSAILEDPRLDGHLTKKGDRVELGGGCRTVTSRIPAWRAQALSGLVAGALSGALDGRAADCRVWRLGADTSIDVVKIDGLLPRTYRVETWTVVVPNAIQERILGLRAGRLPSETGGVLLGVLDLTIRRIDLVAAWPQPADSLAGPSFFERGVSGLDKEVADALARTADQVRYVGEWHSHPDLYSTIPSTIDVTQIMTFAEILDADDCPFLMVIADENGLSVTLGQLR